jgi:plasmid stability protein
MAQLVVRKLDDDLKEGLKRRARRHGRSTEEEVREILRNAIKSEGVNVIGLGSRIAARFRDIGLTTDEEIKELRGQEVNPAEFDP